MKTIIIFITISLSSLNVLIAQNNWQLVYQNDDKGNAVDGDLKQLISAVKRGKEVRVAWWGKRVYHTAEAAFLTIMTDSVVTAQIRPIYGQTPEFENYTITLKENLEWVLIVGTNGAGDAMMSNKSTGEIVGHRSRRIPVKWFVKK